MFAPDLIVLAKQYGGGPIVGLDPATGATRFETEGLAALRDGRGPLYLIGMAPGPATATGDVTVTEVAPTDGAPVRTIALAPPVPTFPPARFALAGDDLIVVTDGAVAAYDLGTGKRRWRTDAPASYLFAPLVLRDRVIVVNQTYAAVRLTDGAVAWTHAGTCCDAVATPDGAHLYVRQAEGRSAELDARGQVVRELAGEVRAATDAWIAVATAGGLDVEPLAPGGPRWHKPVPAGDSVPAVGAAAGWLTYFDADTATLWLARPDGADRVAVRVAQSRLVISPDASGTAPAFIGAPLVWTGDRAYVLDWELHAYEVIDGR